MFKSVVYFALLLPMVLFASEAPDISEFPKNLTTIVNKNKFQPIGEATFSVLFWDIYKSKLLTTSGKYPINAQKEQLIYEINYFADISRDDLIQRTEEQWQNIGVSIESYQDFLPKLKRIWPDIVKGDTLSLHIHSQSSHFYFNQNYIGSIDSPSFGRIFLDIWLAKNTSQPELRAQLLGENTDE